MNDKPRALLRRLLNDTAMIIDGMRARGGFSEDEIDTVCRVYAEAHLRPRRVAPVRPDPEYGWVDGAWMPLGGRETETDSKSQETEMHISEMKSSKYLTAEGIKDHPLTLTIDHLKREKMSDGKDKWVMYFREITEGWVLNKTGINTLGEYFGDETDDWERQKVILIAEMVQMGDKRVPGIRPHLPRPKPQPAARPVGKPARPVTQEEADLPDDGWEPGRE